MEGAESGYRPALVPADEPERIEELRMLRLLDTANEARFDRFTKLAADLFGVPVALFNLVDTNRVWFKSARGPALAATPRDVSFCAHAILERQLLVIPDATQDERFAGNPLVTGPPHIRFYAGAVLHGPRGKAIGTLCVIDHQPRAFSDTDQERLLALAAILEEEVRHEGDIQAARQRAFENAHYDVTTGLPNARLFSDRLQQSLSISRRSQGTLLVALAELNDLAELRAVLGKDACDELLRTCAERLSRALSSLCSIARWREETFALLLPTLSHFGSADAFLTLVCSTLAEPMICDGRTLHLDAACGAATYPESGLDADELIQHAAIAVRKTKESPQRRWSLYSDEMSATMVRRVDLEQRLREAVTAGALAVSYQPIVDFGTMEIHRVEALCRWVDPKFGSVDPEEFIQLAERSDLILDIDRQVMHKAVQALIEWERAGLRPLALSVNISSRTLMHADLLEWLRETVINAGLDPARVVLEVTENSLAADLGLARQNIFQCRQLGFNVAIDDFGTGFSSFNYLKSLSIDELKLDRAFVHEMTERRRDASIANTIITLARDLGVPVVAEGIETREQLVYLQAYNCDEGQGFYFDVPLDPGTVVKRLSKSGDRFVADENSTGDAR